MFRCGIPKFLNTLGPEPMKCVSYSDVLSTRASQNRLYESIVLFKIEKKIIESAEYRTISLHVRS